MGGFKGASLSCAGESLGTECNITNPKTKSSRTELAACEIRRLKTISSQKLTKNKLLLSFRFAIVKVTQCILSVCHTSQPQQILDLIC